MGNVSGSGAGKVPVSPELDNLFKNILSQTGPARKLEFQQLTEALSTGGVGARIPIIQRAVEAAMGANQQSETLGREATARAGQAGSPFDVASQLGTRTENSARVAAIGPQYAAGLIQQGPAMIQNATTQALAANQQQVGQEEFNAAQFGKFMEDLQSTFTGWYGGGSKGGGPAPQSSSSSPTTIDYAGTGQGDPSTFDAMGAQFME